MAAKNGHLQVYKFLHEKTNEINPTIQKQITPLHLAAQYGHFNICQYICDNTEFVRPLRSDLNTPLTLAVHRGHFKIARLLFKKDHPMLRIAWILFVFIYCTLNGMFVSNIIPICILTLMFIGYVWYILNDIRFCLWASPKLDY